MNVRRAYAECRRLARHYENFPVASRLVPKDRRDALAAIYAFARSADDFADEPRFGARLEKLDEWREKLGTSFRGQAEDPVFVALADAVGKFGLKQKPFDFLLDAFEMDSRGTAFPDFKALMAYCERSANPVGRLVLALFGDRDAEHARLSDCICTALQLTNFWQDVAVDFKRGRIYIPLEDFTRFGYSREGLVTGRADERWRNLMAFEVRRTRELFERGRPLTDLADARLRRQLRTTWRGGMAILNKIEALDYDTLNRRPRLSKLEAVWLYLQSGRRLSPLAPAKAAASAMD